MPLLSSCLPTGPSPQPAFLAANSKELFPKSSSFHRLIAGDNSHGLQLSNDCSMSWEFQIVTTMSQRNVSKEFHSETFT